MKTWMIVRKEDLAILGSYMAEEKDETSNNRSHLLAQPHCMHMELPEGVEAKYAKCEMVEGEATILHSEEKELAEVEQAWSMLRAQRDQKLAETDKYVLTDYPISAENLQAIKDYRNDLRDLPSSVVDPRQAVQWPEMPEV